MATTKGKITLTSTDLVSDAINFNVEQTLAKAPYGDGCDATSGLARVTIGSGTTYTFDCDDVFVRKSTANSTPGTNFHKNYLYIKNVNDANVTLKVTYDHSTHLPALSGCTEEGAGNCDGTIAMLEKNDWMFIPWTANVDIMLRATTSANCLMEYMIIN